MNAKMKTNEFKGIKKHLFFYKRFDLNEVFDKLNFRNEKESKEIFDGEEVKMNSLRLHTFKEKGCTCVECGRVGTHFRLQKTIKDNHYHFGLYSDDEVEMTKDHIIPKSRGGLDSLSNMQTMCNICNSLKGNSYTASDVIKGEALDKSLLKKDGSEKTNFASKIEKEKIEYKNYNISDINKKYPDVILHRKKINDYMKVNHTNPYNIFVSDEMEESVNYIKSYYFEVIDRHNGLISLRNKKITGITKELRKELIVKVLNQK